MTVWNDLGVTLPVVAAPMAGGPSTPSLVRAVADTGGFGFLAAGYRTADALADQLDAVNDGAWGVNLFAPNPVPVDAATFARFRAELVAEADVLGVDLPDESVEDDDHWRDKLDLLLERPAPIVSFTFGIPEPAVLTAVRRAGSVLAQTVTSPSEALFATEAGVDVLIVQAAAAGGHSGTLTPLRPPPALALPDLLDAVRAVTPLPLIATGGVADATGVADALAHGAQAVAIGTALLLAPECGTSDVHRRALQQDRGDTVVTRSFTGRPARALPNDFVHRFDALAPSGYPALHHLTAPLRRAAAAAGDVERVHLWAGTGYRGVVTRPAADTVRLLSRLV